MLRTALEQQAEPVSQAVIVGALFDFMGWLTTRKERLVLSSTDNASPAADAIKDFAKMRGLSLDDAKVQDWQNYTTPPQRKELSASEILNMMPSTIPAEYDGELMEFARAVEAKLPAQRPWVSLTDEEINANRTLRYHFSLNNGPVTRAGIAVVETIEAMLKAKNHG